MGRKWDGTACHTDVRGTTLSAAVEAELSPKLTFSVALVTKALFDVHRGGTYAEEEKTFVTTGHSLNAFSEPRPGRLLELVEARKS